MTIADFVVDGVLISCDEFGPTRRCPCTDWPGWPTDPAPHDSHWWDNAGSPWWCGGDLDLDWRLKAAET